MTAQTWRAHYAQKYQYSLRLFLLLNFISSSLSLVTPIYGSSFHAALRPDRGLQRVAATLALEMAAIENKYFRYLVVIWHAMGMARSDKGDAIDTAAF